MRKLKYVGPTYKFPSRYLPIKGYCVPAICWLAIHCAYIKLIRFKSLDLYTFLDFNVISLITERTDPAWLQLLTFQHEDDAMSVD